MNCSSFLFANKVLVRDWLQAALVEANSLKQATSLKSSSGSAIDLLRNDCLEPLDANAFYPKSSYLAQAGHYIKVANEYESCGELENAFYAYKSCIEILLIGVATEKDPDKRACVSDKVTEYITVASQILLNSLLPLYNEDGGLWREHLISSNPNFDHLKRPLSELNSYRVFKILNQSVVVFDDLGAKYILRVIPKCANRSFRFDKCPPQLDLMSNICSVYELENVWVFCLEYIMGELLITRMQPDHGISLVETPENLDNGLMFVPNETELENGAEKKQTESINRVSASNTITELQNDNSNLTNSCEKREKSLAELLFSEADSDNSDFALTLTENDLREATSPKCQRYKRDEVSTANFIAAFVKFNATSAQPTIRKQSSKIGKAPLKVVQKWITQMLQCLNELHSLEVFWGCITPRDIFLHRNGNIKFKHCLTWLNDSKSIDEWLLDPYCVSFIAPELLEDFMFMVPNSQSDLWSLGAVIYTLITGRFFAADFPSYLLEEEEIMDLPGEFNCAGLQNLLRYLLQRRPDLRLTFEEAISDPFLNSFHFPEI